MQKLCVLYVALILVAILCVINLRPIYPLIFIITAFFWMWSLGAAITGSWWPREGE
jgi:hypothetical protein